MTLAIIFLVFGILVVYLLLMPIILSIDTEKNEYFIQLKGLVKAYLEPHQEEIIRIKLNIFFMTFYFFPIDQYYKRKRTKKLKQKSPKPKKNKTKNSFSLDKGIKILKTIKVKRFAIDLDTGDVVQNAKLYPAFALLNYYKGGFNINFEGRNKLVVHLQDRPIDILKVFINP